MKNINFPALLIASSLLVGCGKQTPEAQANEIAEQKLRIELANKLQEQVTNNTAQIMCAISTGDNHLPIQVIVAGDTIYKLNPERLDRTEKLQNASDIYQNSKDKLVAAKIIRNQECGLTF
jgi:hypothetical protein